MDPMKILFSSYAFSPAVGGIETVSAILAAHFTQAGHEVIVVTATPGSEQNTPYAIVRQPGLRSLFRLLRSADVVFQNNIILGVLLPALMTQKPVLLVHQTWIRG